MYTKVCELCGKQFTTNYKRQRFCKQEHAFACVVCGKKILVSKDLGYYATRVKSGTLCCCRSCSMKLAHANATEQSKKAVREKQSNSIKKYLNEHGSERAQRIRATKLAKYGNETYNNREKSAKTCQQRYGVSNPAKLDSNVQKAKQTKLCKYGDAVYNNRAKAEETNMQKYGVSNAMQNSEIKKKYTQVVLSKYGSTSSLGNKEVQQKAHNTLLRKYGVSNAMQIPASRAKAKQTQIDKYGGAYVKTQEYKKRKEYTCLQKYGVDNAAKSSICKMKSRRTMLERYGAEHPSKVPEIRRKQVANARTSKLEIRVANLLDQYGIDYVQQFVVSKDGHTHAFDFYIPEYKILLDADGVYYHSYISDPDGKQVRDDYDEVRMYLVPEDHIFILAVEGQEEKAIKHVYDVIKSIDEDVFNYDTELFKWCRSIDFPYPKYSSERMLHDWDMLCSYANSKYVPQCKLGMSIVKNFHASIYDARVGNSVSTKEAWHDDAKLKKVIANRLIYQNTVDPNKVLQGFNISKIAPTVSLFNPVLARYLTLKYLTQYKEVFDPFSGFSGRLLGVASTGKQYTGQDISSIHVQESNSIVEFLSLQSCCSVSCNDVLQSSGSYECLITCPPYGSKETYGSETEFKSCDEWIDECVQRFSCKAYVFVVDSTEKYNQYVTETLHNSSHFSKSNEYVVVIK